MYINTFLKDDFSLIEILDSKQNWVEGMEISHIPLPDTYIASAFHLVPPQFTFVITDEMTLINHHQLKYVG
jgi:hypothetical protein